MFKNLFNRFKTLMGQEQFGPGHEFCPRCEANLTLQRGYSNDLPFWVCLGCGEMLINPKIDTDSNIAWICDGCGRMLNIQPGFTEDCGEWSCTECGQVNKIDKSELFSTEDEYQAALHDPYKGLSDSAVLELSCYQEEKRIGERGTVLLVRNREDGRRYVEKLLDVYNKSVYEYLEKYPISHMPRIIKLYESENCLIVIEEYIEGHTVEKLLEEGSLTEEQAVGIVRSVCRILENLHSLPTPIIHRDIKPSNIIITPGGEVFLLDMNIAKWYDPEKTDDTRYMGTYEYAAPEQAGYGLVASSAKSDIYAVGILLNVMLTGEFPKRKRAEGRIWEIIARCISLNAKDRYTAGELLEALEGL